MPHTKTALSRRQGKLVTCVLIWSLHCYVLLVKIRLYIHESMNACQSDFRLRSFVYLTDVTILANRRVLSDTINVLIKMAIVSVV